ncbi:hypothetical protein IMSAGC012_03526 [Lachnospiraceae bacterium]|nr:M23 family metallopeptidase [Eubacterium sp.]GFI28394.1 hypothetical protein IMSAGC012_03526 [Lachnospiraceae bacterium]
MRRGNNFFRRNQYKIAAVCLAAAILGLTGAYVYTARGTGEEENQQVAVKETEKAERKTVAKKETEPKQETEQDSRKTAIASTVVKPKKEIPTRTKTVAEPENAADTAKAEDNETGQTAEDETAETAAVLEPAADLHFDAQAGLVWPVEGAVILDYNMEQTVYFSTLDQYKYNPAVIISGNVNDKVKAAANGKITDISTNEVTGCTVTMDLGDGYTAVYGQLKEVPYEAGAYLEAGNTIGFVSEPTKYYSLEGSNVYFALEKDGEPVDPVEFFQ